jgi:hypothetical protein
MMTLDFPSERTATSIPAVLGRIPIDTRPS